MASIDPSLGIDSGTSRIDPSIPSEPEFPSFGNFGIPVFDPASGASTGDNAGDNTDGDGSSTKRRGRPPGTGAGEKSKKKASDDLKGMSSLLFSIHGMLAAATKIEELAISQEESEQLAKSISEVEKHYNVFAASEKAADWANLMITLSAVYGTRIFAYKMRARHEKEKDNKRRDSQSDFPSAFHSAQ